MKKISKNMRNKFLLKILLKDPILETKEIFIKILVIFDQNSKKILAHFIMEARKEFLKQN